MKTKAFIQNRVGTISQETGAPRKASTRGFVGKSALVLLVLVVVAAGGFALHVKGKVPLDSLLPATVKAGETTDPGVPSPRVSSEGSTETDPVAETPTSTPIPVANSLPPALAASTPAGPRQAPAGTVFLAKRITLTKDTGILSFGRGSVLVVKSKSGGKIRGSIRGVPIEVAEADTLTTIEESELVPVVSKK